MTEVRESGTFSRFSVGFRRGATHRNKIGFSNPTIVVVLATRKRKAEVAEDRAAPIRYFDVRFGANGTERD